jgi:hypothetical protein
LLFLQTIKMICIRSTQNRLRAMQQGAFESGGHGRRPLNERPLTGYGKAADQVGC